MQDILEEYRRDVRRVYADLDKLLAGLEGSGALAAYSADCERVLADAKAGRAVERDDDGKALLPTSPDKTARAKAAQLIGAASKRGRAGRDPRDCPARVPPDRRQGRAT